MKAQEMHAKVYVPAVSDNYCDKGKKINITQVDKGMASLCSVRHDRNL